jgi:hypothetical protein
MLIRLSSRLAASGEAIEDFVPGDCAVDDDMTDMDSNLGVFLRHSLRERSKPSLR